MFVCIVREILVSVCYGAFIPFADAGIVSAFEAQFTVRRNCGPWMRIIQDRGEVVRACREVVGDSQRMANFMCRELPDSGKRHFKHIGIGFSTCFIWSKQPFGNHVVLANSE